MLKRAKNSTRNIKSMNLAQYIYIVILQSPRTYGAWGGRDKNKNKYCYT